MKKIIAMAALVLSSVGAFAQYSAGDFTLQPKVGLNCTFYHRRQRRRLQGRFRWWS